MAAAASSRFCPNCPPDKICEELRRQIKEKVFQRYSDTGVRGLAERINDQIAGGQARFTGHDIAITQVKNEIRDRMKDFSRNDCGDKAPLGAETKKWINTDNPTRDDLEDQTGRAAAEAEDKAKAASTSSSPSMFSYDGMAKATGLTGAALMTYLVISEGSRLFPPRNLIPVP